jgi:predicted aldo/keto reductase-like oxidoreductase
MITSDPSVVTRAADLGITYFDTARGYQHGNNERMVGTALGDKRKQVVLSTKTEARDKAGMAKELDTSLSELKTDFVDVWYLHGKSNPSEIHDDMIEALQLAKQQGKARFVGVSTHSNQQTLIPWMVQKGVFDVVLSAFNFSMDPAVEQAINAAAKTGMGVVAMKVMAGGARGQKAGQTMLSTLKWVTNHPSVATTIPSMTDMAQLDENVQAMGSTLTAEDHRVLAGHLKMIEAEYCRMCGKCEGTCAQGLPVADVLRYVTYADGYGQFALGRERYLQMASEHVEARCENCPVCTVQCPFGVKVQMRMKRAQELFA